MPVPDSLLPYPDARIPVPHSVLTYVHGIPVPDSLPWRAHTSTTFRTAIPLHPHASTTFRTDLRTRAWQYQIAYRDARMPVPHSVLPYRGVPHSVLTYVHGVCTSLRSGDLPGVPSCTCKYGTLVRCYGYFLSLSAVIVCDQGKVIPGLAGADHIGKFLRF
eukprot:3432438-Rhodomonas_salina.1